MKTLIVMIGLLAASAISQQADHNLVLRGTDGFAVVTDSKIYLTNPTGQVYAVIAQAVTGAPRGVIAVHNPATGNSILLDPDFGVTVNGRVTIPVGPSSEVR